MSLIAARKTPDGLVWTVFALSVLVLLLVIAVPSLVSNPGARAGAVPERAP